MHDCALEQKRGRGVFSAPRVEHTSHCSKISIATGQKTSGVFDHNFKKYLKNTDKTKKQIKFLIMIDVQIKIGVCD